MSNYQAHIKAEFMRSIKRNLDPWANPSRWRHQAKLTRYYARTMKGGRFVPEKTNNKEGRSDG